MVDWEGAEAAGEEEDVVLCREDLQVAALDAARVVQVASAQEKDVDVLSTLGANHRELVGLREEVKLLRSGVRRLRADFGVEADRREAVDQAAAAAPSPAAEIAAAVAAAIAALPQPAADGSGGGGGGSGGVGAGALSGNDRGEEEDFSDIG
jgi:hypothetical protein